MNEGGPIHLRGPIHARADGLCFVLGGNPVLRLPVQRARRNTTDLYEWDQKLARNSENGKI